ncbi:tubulin epsilon and delta complex protein 2 isoform X2 [Coturnix japonica]|uniref:tubulin epsilon and delta complex protein 2 isoform X2 n=1 Tax=Coturnix japonica TaxID=93934 RepID=UPI0007778D30|nr:tubulin epsilon and delta complex protein 2 isoform X2 [Coturnix japonica]
MARHNTCPAPPASFLSPPAVAVPAGSAAGRAALGTAPGPGRAGRSAGRRRDAGYGTRDAGYRIRDTGCCRRDAAGGSSAEMKRPEAEAGPGAGRAGPCAPRAESSTSARELQELELLNAALQKALRVRNSVSGTNAPTRGAAGAKPAGEAADGDTAELKVPAATTDGAAAAGTSCEVRGSSQEHSAAKKPPYRLRAPYRTEPDVRRTQRKTPAGRVGRAAGAAAKSSSKAVASKQGRSRGQPVRAAAEPQRTVGIPRSAHSEQLSLPAGEGSSVSVCGQQPSAGQSCCGSLGPPGAEEHTAGAGSAALRAAALQEQRFQLELPLPYRKAHARNSRAWEKCRLCHTRADAAAARKCFTERIQSTFRSPTPTLSPAEIEEELRALQDIPSHLSLCVEAESADHPTLQREYESLLTLEALQSTVSQYLHKLQLLRAAVESQRRLQPDCTGEQGDCCAACAAGARLCGSADTLAVPLLCYSRLQELRDLFALKLRVSMLHQEIALQKLTMTELLPVLDSRPCPGASAAQLYRAMYTQLCEGGGRFPVLVQDELSD